MAAAIDTVILDLDGTLVDTNYHHTLSWYRTLRSFGITVPVWRIHRSIGKGGDQLVPSLAGDDFEREHGDDARDKWKDEFEPMLEEVQPLEGAKDLLRYLKGAGLKVALASSGDPAHVDHYLDLIDGRELADKWTTAEDVEASKPAPDLVALALREVGGKRAVMIGDAVWDVIAAKKIDIPTFAIRTGGFSVGELEEAGAVRVFDKLSELQEHLEQGGLDQLAD